VTTHRYIVDDPPTLEAFHRRLVAALLPPSDFVVTAHREIDELSAHRGEVSGPRSFRFRLRELTERDSPYWHVYAEIVDTGQWVAFTHNPETDEITFEDHHDTP
jgi:hypothetical protein